MLTAEQRHEIIADYNLAVQEMNMTIIEIQWCMAKGRGGVFGKGNPWGVDDSMFLYEKESDLIKKLLGY